MGDLISSLMAQIQANPTLYVVLGGVGIGAGCIWLGLASAIAASDGGTKRMRRLARGAPGAPGAARVQLVKTGDATPTGMLRSLLPEDRNARLAVKDQLAMAGFTGAEAVRNFYVARLVIALSLPALLAVLLGLQKLIVLPEALDAFVVGLSGLRLFQLCMGSVALGFYAPLWWLRARVRARRDRVEAGFPNALDLLQISAEAGLGFDAAMGRVGKELARVSPEIAQEFLICQTEIGAGRDRGEAMSAMADRMGIAEARSFANVVGQSLQFGTSLAEALRAYAIEMRQARELRAQEKANKLPVQMSAVMATLMLPALFLITLTPIALRYLKAF